MKAILAPTDFSDVSVNAVNYAAGLAMSLDAELVLMHVNEYIFAYSDAGVVDFMLEEHSDDKLAALETELLSKANGKLRTRKYISSGKFQNELRNFCDNTQPFAIVMGTHDDLSGFDRLLMESQSFYASKNLNFPVIVVPRNAGWYKVSSIGFACDLKNIYDIPAEKIKNIQETFKAALHVVHVSKNKEQENKDAVEALLLQPSLMTNNTELHVIENADTAAGLEAFAKDFNIDLVILLAKDYGMIGNLLHKSQLKKMIMHPKMPLMILH